VTLHLRKVTLRGARHYPKEEVTADEGAGATLEVHLTDRVSTINPMLQHMAELHQISRKPMTDVADSVGEGEVVVVVAPVVVGEATETFLSIDNRFSYPHPHAFHTFLITYHSVHFTSDPCVLVLYVPS